MKSWILFGAIFDADKIIKQLINLRNKTEDQDFWSDPDEAKKVMMSISENEYKINLISNFENKISEVNDYYNLAKEESDDVSINECHTTITAILSELEENEFKLQFNGDADSKSCYLEIHAGAGGTESQDWAQMLLRMYMRWAEKKKFKFKLMYESLGEEAGIKSCKQLWK